LVLTGNASLNTFGVAGGLGLGGVSGVGGLVIRPAGAGQTSVFNVANTYSGATVIGQNLYGNTASPTNAGGMRLNSAAGSALNTASFTVSDGGLLEIHKGNGDTFNNARVSTSSAINLNSAFLQVIGSLGTSSQNFGTVNTTGLATILANTQAAAGSSTAITIANLAVGANSTVTFAGGANTGLADTNSLGNLATGPGVSTGNIFLTQVNGAAPATALVGGGGAGGTTTISIFPWAIGTGTITGSNFGAGSAGTSSFQGGFTTYGPNGVRLLIASEYNTGNNFTTVGTTDNVRITGAITNPAANTTINSLFVASTGQTLNGGANNRHHYQWGVGHQRGCVYHFQPGALWCLWK
jgi:hypothetical protein